MSGRLRRAWLAPENFAMLHFDLVDELDGDHAAALVLDRILYYSRGGNGWWTATYEEIRVATRLSEHRVRDAITVLREHDLIRSKRVSAWDSTQEWQGAFEEESPSLSVSSQVDESVHPEAYESARPEVYESSRPERTDPQSLLSLEERKNPPTPQRGAAFEEFWSLYPRKEGKGAARKVWDHLPPAQTRAALDGLRAQLPDMTRKERKYQPMPVTWLRQARWEDEAVSATPPRQVVGRDWWPR